MASLLLHSTNYLIKNCVALQKRHLTQSEQFFKSSPWSTPQPSKRSQKKKMVWIIWKITSYLPNNNNNNNDSSSKKKKESQIPLEQLEKKYVNHSYAHWVALKNFVRKLNFVYILPHKRNKTIVVG